MLVRLWLIHIHLNIQYSCLIKDCLCASAYSNLTVTQISRICFGKVNYCPLLLLDIVSTQPTHKYFWRKSKCGTRHSQYVCTIDTFTWPPLTWFEIFLCVCLKSYLQTFPSNSLKINPLIWEYILTFQSPPPQKK